MGYKSTNANIRLNLCGNHATLMHVPALASTTRLDDLPNAFDYVQVVKEQQAGLNAKLI